MSDGYDAYAALEGVNWSSLRYMARSPAHYRQNLLAKKKATAPMKMGRVAHMAVLEPERFAFEYVLWDGGTRRGKEWEAFKARHEAAGREILKEGEHDEALAISAAARADRVASRYLTKGKAEQVIQWEMRGHKCKGRLDFISDAGAIVDLKTTKDASPSQFGKQVVNLMHLGQAAFYVDGYAAATGRTLPYVLIAAEKEPPHVVQVYRLVERQLELGRDLYRSLLDRLTECRASNYWPGYADDELELVLPKWADPWADTDEDLSELDLNFAEGSA